MQKDKRTGWEPITFVHYLHEEEEAFSEAGKSLAKAF